MNHLGPFDETIVEVRNTNTSSSVVFVCEHASAYIPAEFEGLGLPEDALTSHVAWDPGAMALAERLTERFNGVLIAARTSRLVYDCNRPPEVPDAMPARSEIFDIPGNAHLTASDRADRVRTYYQPFRQAVSDAMSAIKDPVLVTVHSFTPIYHGKTRDVEIGVLHDDDARLADALLDVATRSGKHVVRRNEPYGPGDGVTHTLKEHALPGGYLNVMLEVRSDLVATGAAQGAMVETLSGWLEGALAATRTAPC
ncbi:Predicted N-formylglutamate amidohydrolase [Jannaschia faecimaris]|uniref:Predicted N-formylglutamate amidohydrolase n=2 Tax=Jannaschia faecimaris TaxID=1244108 RepID=A0A1H3TVX5_9RHOB|nr:Predicted N-formylglutamate amidohydrolase [Jannaschia faecimaris]